MSRFFIDRPVFAIVLSLLIVLGGIFAVESLPVEQLPPVTPPTVQISASYPGASAITLQNTVVQVIEQQMSGIDHLLYMSSNSNDSGQAVTTMTFEPGTNADIAQVQVQNKLQLAVPLLPPQVQQTGLKVTKSMNAFLLAIGFVSTDGRMDRYDIANFVASQVQDPISRLDGVGNLQLFGTQFAIRVWLDLAKLNDYAMTPLDVVNALQQQNVQISAGQLGGPPAIQNQALTATITESTMMRSPQEFGGILLKVQQDGSQVRLRDVAHIDRGAENYTVTSKYKGLPGTVLAIQAAPGANALQTANAIRAKMKELAPYLPAGLQVVYPNDVTPFITASLEEVVKTLLEGIVLVFLIMYLFLQNVRATIIPSVTVPVVLLGTFGIMSALGFTINTLSMFGMVLAIGLLVDDAIVVVENVERVMQEEHLGPLEATRKAMSQIGGALIGVAMVLCAVFVPVAFTSGTAGAIYRQFSLTIVAAMLLSVFVALTLTPALCATMLKPHQPGQTPGRFFSWFNRVFDRNRDRYVGGVKSVIARPLRWMIVYVAVGVAVVLMFRVIPTSFLPNEDQGYLYVQVQTPPGSTLEHTMQVLDRVNDYLLEYEKAMVIQTFALDGQNNSGRGQNLGQLFVRLKDWNERGDPKLSADALVARIGQRFGHDADAAIVGVAPPAIRGLGAESGFDFQLVDRGGIGHEALIAAREQLLAAAAKDPQLARVRLLGQMDNPTYKIDIDREKAAALGVNASDIDQTFSVAWGARYVNNFLDSDNRIKKVYVQAAAPFRMDPQDLRRLYVRDSGGKNMVPFSAFATGKWTYGPPQLQRYNGVESMEILGQAAPGHSTGEAMAAMERLAATLPPGVGYEWAGASLQERQAGSQAPLLYALSILIVFLSLAALYESWSLPLSVIMVVPIGVLGALLFTWLGHLSNDVYFQVGLLTTIGLSAKNAILIVEFARSLQLEGVPPLAAAIEAAKTRLRPIIMTSMAFILGVLPMAIAHGAGAMSQKAIGIGVIGGMLTATFLATFLIPLFFVLVTGGFDRSRQAAGPAPAVQAIPDGEH